MGNHVVQARLDLLAVLIKIRIVVLMQRVMVMAVV